MAAAQVERLARLRQMLDYVQQHNDVDAANLLEACVVGHALQHMQAIAPTMSGCLISQFDASNFEMKSRLLKKKPIGAAYFQQFTAGANAANEIDSARELASEHGFGTKVIGVSVDMAPRKIIGGVIGCWIKICGLGTPETTS